MLKLLASYASSVDKVTSVFKELKGSLIKQLCVVARQTSAIGRILERLPCFRHTRSKRLKNERRLSSAGIANLEQTNRLPRIELDRAQRDIEDLRSRLTGCPMAEVVLPLMAPIVGDVIFCNISNMRSNAGSSDGGVLL